MRYVLALMLGVVGTVGPIQAQDRSSYFIEVYDYYLQKKTWQDAANEVKTSKIGLGHILVRNGTGSNGRLTILEFHGANGRITHHGPQMSTVELTQLRDLCRCAIYIDRDNIARSPRRLIYEEWRP